MMDRLLENETALKIIAVVVAIALWVAANGSRVQTNQRNIAGVPLEWTLPQNGGLTVLSMKPTTVTILVQGTPQQLSGLSVGKVAAWVNLSGLNHPGTYSLVVAASVPSGTSVASISPNHILVAVDSVGHNRLPVTFHVSGSPHAGYRVKSTGPGSTEVTVSGPESLLGRVKAVQANVSVAGKQSSFTQQVALEAVDGSGRQLSQVTVSPSLMNVTVTIAAIPPTVHPNVVARYTGQPASGYHVGGITVTPSTIAVSGPQSAVSGIHYVDTVPVDISGAKGPVTATVGLAVPGGTQASPAQVKVNIDVIP